MKELHNGKIVKINKDFYTILLENFNRVECKTRGKLRNNYIKPVVGDNVKIDINTLTIEDVQTRKNYLLRPLIANIDKLFIICSLKTPDFSSYLLDKFLVLAHLNNIKPVIVITKFDKLNFKEKKSIKKILKYYSKIGYKVFINTQINKIKKEFKNCVVSLAGQTGSGKSTLLNKIDKNLHLKTDEISISLGRGKHTTRIVELYSINDGLIADTPGFSALDIEFEKNKIKEGFIEFKNNCKYRSCLHSNEDGCKIREEVIKGKILKSRYENYLKIINEVK